MCKHIDMMENIREDQLTRTFHSLIFIGFFVLIASLSRSLFMGWYDFLFIHIGSYLAIIGIEVCKNHISYAVKTSLLVIIIFILAVSGLAQLGLAGYGIGLLFIFCIVSTIFYGTRGGITAAILSAFSIAVIGTAFVNGIITYNFDISGYVKSPATWLLGTVGMCLFASLIVTIISKINNQLIQLVRDLNRQNTELKAANKKLEDTLEEKKQLKIGLEQAQKMELVGVMAGGVAHDLNNVLSASINYPELLLLDIPKNSPLKKPIETIKKSGLKAAAIVDDLLTLSRRRVARTTVLNINNIVAECITSPEIGRLKAYHPKVDIEINLDENLWNIEGFPIHLAKTLTNLVSNAAEAMRDGGEISIETLNMVIAEENPADRGITTGKYSVLKISDEGEGISEDDQEKIFEPFYTKKEMGRSGTGLGMTIVWNTVKDHNGHIILDSVKGKGTTFILYFPMTDKPLPLEKGPVQIPLRNGKSESILIVDDVQDQREIAGEILSGLGYVVITKASGEDALEYIKHNNADLVLIDMIMHGMDGLDTYRKVLELRPEQKAIIISGFSETERIKEALELGAGAYLKKPYTMEAIALAVRQELNKKNTVMK